MEHHFLLRNIVQTQTLTHMYITSPLWTFVPLWVPLRDRVQKLCPAGLEIDEVIVGALLSTETLPPTEKKSAFMRHQSVKPHLRPQLQLDKISTTSLAIEKNRSYTLACN
jgi:hypothetical protein